MRSIIEQPSARPELPSKLTKSRCGIAWPVRRGRRWFDIRIRHWRPAASAVEFYALGGQGKGTPLRATISSFGPILLSKVLELNETQESSLGLVFHFADQAGLPLLDLQDLVAVLKYLDSDEGKPVLKQMVEVFNYHRCSVLGTMNVVGGYVVTDRMLEMFKSDKGKKKEEEAK